MSTIKKNDEVKDIYGEWHTVYEVIDNVIYTLDQTHIHISKVTKVAGQS
jgi:hypothetical protein